jgi:hypothetical protein
LSTERWADEAAATPCRRDTVADALTHTAARAVGGTPRVPATSVRGPRS